MFQLYLLTNIQNGKQYIGQTTVSLEERWKTHIRESRRSHLPLYAAIQKYGRESFILSFLDDAASQEELNQKEIDYIAAYNTQNRKFGYNIHEGGNKPPLATSETSKKAGRKTRGKKRTGVALENIRAGAKKRRQSSSTFKKGHSVPVEWRKKIGAAHKDSDTMRTMWEKSKFLRRQRIDAITEKILKLYESGFSMREIGKTFGCCHSAVRKRILENRGEQS